VAKRVTITMRLAENLPAVRADSAQLQQVVMNLITNAAEAIPEGQIGEVVLSTEVLHCTRQDLDRSRLPERPSEGAFVCLRVVDNGCGMNPEALDRLFEPFYTTKTSGRGLGMSATLGIVRGHRGAIIVESVEKTGTVIQVLLPASDKAVREAGVAIGGEQIWRGQGTVLLVDDEEAVRSLAARMLERMGFTVLTAADGVEGIELFRARAEEVRCVLLDFSMPRMDGVQASQELHRIKSGVPIVVCSGFNRPEVEHRFQGVPIASFLHKPFRYEELGQAFRMALGES
jgi:CheY-like chemotaxis protein